MHIDDGLRNIIKEEGGWPLSDDVLNQFLENGQKVLLAKGDFIIKPGTIDRSIWITAKGVAKAIYDDGNRQYVFGFSGPGTITMSPISYVLGREAFCGFQTITECEMIRIEKDDFDNLMKSSDEFARWMFGVLICQFCAFELKTQILSDGDATSKFKALVKHQMKLDKDGFDPYRPDLLSVISSKDLASYIGITQSYLSNIRKAIIDEDRKSKDNGESAEF